MPLAGCATWAFGPSRFFAGSQDATTLHRCTSFHGLYFDVFCVSAVADQTMNSAKQSQKND